MKYTREELQEQLRNGERVVHFTKLDGDVRIMNCTLNEDLIPSDAMPKGTGKAPSEKQLENLSVYDLNAKGWRSFRVANVFDVVEVDQAYDELIDTLKDTVRHYRIRLWGYGGEHVYNTVSPAAYEYWSEREDLEDYVFSNEEYMEENKVPKGADFLQEEGYETRTEWHEFDRLDHVYGVEYYSARIDITQVENDEYMAKDIETIVEGETLNEWVDQNDVSLDMKLHTIDNRLDGARNVAFLYSAEKGTFFDGLLSIKGGKKFDPKRLLIETIEQPNEDDVVVSVVYDGEEIDNLGGDTNGKGYYATLWEW